MSMPMAKRQFALLVAVTIISGLIGGAVSGRIFMAKSAIAETAQGHEKLLIAEELQLVDREGKTYAVMGKRSILGSDVSPNMTGLWIYDKNDRARFGLMVSDDTDAPMLVFYDDKDQNCIALEASGGSYPQMYFSYRDKDVLRFGVKADGSPYLMFYDDIGAISAIFGIEDGESHITLLGGSLRIYGEDTADPLKMKGGFIKIMDAKGIMRSALGSVETEVTTTGEIRKRSLSSLVLFDKDGKVMWQTP